LRIYGFSRSFVWKIYSLAKDKESVGKQIQPCEMKAISTIVLICTVLSISAQNTDLPSPDQNLQTVPAGSYVIPMDNTLQINTAGNFNLKAYGLVVYLLNNNVRIKWVIKAGKVKDAIDFSAPADLIKPSAAAAAVPDFKAGPFVIFAADTTGVASLIDAFYTNNALTGANRPTVYRLTADVPDVDIRYNLGGFRPKAGIMNDGGNANIHIAYMSAASVPSENYAIILAEELNMNCYTFASEPHNTATGAVVDSTIVTIKRFVQKGGNFLAQCEAINNYENNTLGRFQTTGGMTTTNAAIGSTLTYVNSDLSFTQFEGAYSASIGGSVKNWSIVGSYTNNAHDHVTGTGANASIIGASVSKHYYPNGGLVFYVGNHSFSSTTALGINGIRMYMNAFLTPSNSNCPTLTGVPLAVKLIAFKGSNQSNKTTLYWSVAENELASKFVVEKSVDGKSFSVVSSVTSTIKKGMDSYSFSVTGSSGKFYRLRLYDREGKYYHSPILNVSSDQENESTVKVLNNPSTEDFMVAYNTKKNTMATMNVYSSPGACLYSLKFSAVEGNNILIIPLIKTGKKGLYYIEIIDQNTNRFSTKAVRM